jgi:hypothetical protein
VLARQQPKKKNLHDMDGSFCWLGIGWIGFMEAQVKKVDHLLHSFYYCKEPSSILVIFLTDLSL